MASFSLNATLRPAAQPLPRLSEASKIEIAITQLSRVRTALTDGIMMTNIYGRQRKLSLRDRDELLVDELDRVLAELRRGRL